MGSVSFFVPSWEQRGRFFFFSFFSPNDSGANVLVATLSNAEQTVETALYVSHRSQATRASARFEGAGSESERQMNCLCFPFCLFKYWSTESFRWEIIRDLLSKWDSAEKQNSFFSSLPPPTTQQPLHVGTWVFTEVGPCLRTCSDTMLGILK